MSKDRIVLTTIDSIPATGICGSRLIDQVTCLLETEQPDESGLLEQEISLAENVLLTQQDIISFNLLKERLLPEFRRFSSG